MTAMNDAEREAVEVVGWVDPENIGRMKRRELCGFMIEEKGDSRRSCALMTVAQHERILSALADNSGKPNLSAGGKAVPYGFMPIPTAEQLAEALDNVRSFHDMSAELIAPELLTNLLAALAASTGQEVES